MEMTDRTGRRHTLAFALGVIAAGVLSTPTFAAAAPPTPKEVTALPGGSLSFAGVPCRFDIPNGYEVGSMIMGLTEVANLTAPTLGNTPRLGPWAQNDVRANSWSVTVTLPADLKEGTYAAIPICAKLSDLSGPNSVKFMTDDAVIVHVQSPSTTTTTTRTTTTTTKTEPGPAGPTTSKTPPQANEGSGAPATGPQAVKATPTYTG
jgi:hypothetical protein